MMRRSFRLYLFVQIIVATALIIVANRFVAQYFLTGQMEVRAHQEMARVVTECSHTLSSEHAWRDCARGTEKGQVLSPLVDFFQLCADQLQTQPASCVAARAFEMTWRPLEGGADGVLFATANINQTFWHIMTSANASKPQLVMLSDDDLGIYLQRLWNLRDRNLIYVLPTIVFLLFLLTAYMVYVVMRPIRVMEETLSTLDVKTIHEKTDIQTPYVEFQTLAKVYRDLLKRLDASYANAKRFASDAAHELRTPLSILRGNVERLIPEVPNGSEHQRRLQNLGDEVDRLIVITEKLLMLSRADGNNLMLEIELVDWSALLTELIDDAQSFHTHIQFIKKIQPDVVWPCDRSLIEQLVNNLYANAVKYNLAQGGWIEFKLSATAQALELQVTNATFEVPENLAEKAFERFYRSDASRTRRAVDGLGLGLSICKEVAHAHEGTITLNTPAKNVVSLLLRLPAKQAER